MEKMLDTMVLNHIRKLEAPDNEQLLQISQLQSMLNFKDMNLPFPCIMIYSFAATDII